MDELLLEFLTESAENLGKLDNAIVELERTPGDVALINSVFRTIHTVKGTCGFLGLARLESVAHAAESVLDAVRSGKLLVSAELIGEVLAAVDCIRMILDHLQHHEVEPEGSDATLIATLDSRRMSTNDATCVVACAPAATEAETRSAPATQIVQGTTAQQSESSDAEVQYPSSGRRKEDLDPGKCGMESTLRVSVTMLDQLMNLVGELSLGRNQLLQMVSDRENSEFQNPVHQISRVTTALLDAVTKTRMQPIGNVWTKLPRLVRDLSTSNGKQIVLDLSGAETELDRQILQAIHDPLTHMIRNSADHGIETPEVRLRGGKPAAGTIQLSARHEGGHVIIEVVDDGAGIDIARVRTKAVERGLAKAESVASMDDGQVLRFVFEAGFSTAAQVTNISGRGVGMDVVRSNIEAIGGTVDLSSKPGRGTTIRVKLPLTLAIVSALLVGTSGETFAIPQIGVVELVRITDERRAFVERVNGAEFYRLRDSLLPLVSLHTVLELDAVLSGEDCIIVVCQVGQLRYGLVVEEVFDTQEIVVKPVGRLAKHLPVYAGCTITGDGRVIMILDTTGIAARARVDDRAQRALSGGVEGQTLERDANCVPENFILWDAGFAALQAVPLSRVARLEEFSQSVIEEANGHFLVQYRNVLMPLFAANPSMSIRAVDPRPVIVFSDDGCTIGVAVDEIRDILNEHVVVQKRSVRAGVGGVGVIGGHVTEMIDPDYYLQLGRVAA